MIRPQIDDAPGLAWRKRKEGWVAIWLSRVDGFEPRSQMLRRFTEAPTPEEITQVQSVCLRLQGEMLAWSANPTRPVVFDGRWLGLIRAYQTDPDSPYHSVRFRSRKHYDWMLKRLEHFLGKMPLEKTGGRDFKKLYEKWRWPDGKGGKEQVSNAHHHMTMIRSLVSFGVAFEVEPIRRGRTSECARLQAILRELKFKNHSPRTEAMTFAQCQAVIKEAHHRGKHSIALAQAIQFELAMRQKDVIGEWVPVAEPGVSDVVHAGQKWLRGIRWEEISADLILRHRMSKSNTGKILEFDLKLYPLIMKELERIPRGISGPVVIQEGVDKPWKSKNYGARWREIADHAGLPKSLQNRDSRAGGTTEAIEATGGDLEAARKQAGHSDIGTTQLYSRGLLKSNSNVAVLRVKSRTDKNRP